MHCPGRTIRRLPTCSTLWMAQLQARTVDYGRHDSHLQLQRDPRWLSQARVATSSCRSSQGMSTTSTRRCPSATKPQSTRLRKIAPTKYLVMQGTVAHTLRLFTASKKGDPISRVALTFRSAHYRWVSLCNAHPRAQDCGTARGQRGNEPSAFQDPSQTSEGHDCQVGGMKQPL